MGKRGIYWYIHNISPPSLDYIADRIRRRASEYSLSAYVGGGRIILSGDQVEKQGWRINTVESLASNVVSKSNDWPSKAGN